MVEVSMDKNISYLIHQMFIPYIKIGLMVMALSAATFVEAKVTPNVSRRQQSAQEGRSRARGSGQSQHETIQRKREAAREAVVEAAQRRRAAAQQAEARRRE